MGATMTDRPEQILWPNRRGWLAGVVVLIAIFAVIGWMKPAALWVAVPFLTCIFVARMTVRYGLILSHAGIEWFILSPQWRYRSIPWSAVKHIRWSIFGYGGWIILYVEGGKYERNVWGTPRRERTMTYPIYPHSFALGRGVWDALHNWWLIDDTDEDALDRGTPAPAVPPDPY
jgi:hypothetical protein